MKSVKVLLAVGTSLLLLSSLTFAAGNIEKGKALFNDPKLGTNGTTCNTCHPNGKGLEQAGAKGKEQWVTPGGVTKTLEGAINICITMALKGKALDNKSQKMLDLAAYIKSLATK
jgi:cytochrome c